MVHQHQPGRHVTVHLEDRLHVPSGRHRGIHVTRVHRRLHQGPRRGADRPPVADALGDGDRRHQLPARLEGAAVVAQQHPQHHPGVRLGEAGPESACGRGTVADEVEPRVMVTVHRQEVAAPCAQSGRLRAVTGRRPRGGGLPRGVGRGRPVPGEIGQRCDACRRARELSPFGGEVVRHDRVERRMQEAEPLPDATHPVPEPVQATGQPEGAMRHTRGERGHQRRAVLGLVRGELPHHLRRIRAIERGLAGGDPGQHVRPVPPLGPPTLRRIGLLPREVLDCPQHPIAPGRGARQDGEQRSAHEGGQRLHRGDRRRSPGDGRGSTREASTRTSSAGRYECLAEFLHVRQ